MAFLFTDIEGSTSLLQRLGEGTYAEALADHHELIRGRLADHGGKEVTTQGDGFFAVFSSPRSCVAAVIAMQQALAAHHWVEDAPVRVRMGMHAGEATETITGLIGYDIHRAARVAAVAHGGQVLLSSSAAELVRDFLPDTARLRDLGLHRLKDLSRPERIFQLEATGLRSDFPPLRSLDNPALANNLPAQSSRFVGRERELNELCPLVESHRVVTLTGAGGAGKTRLALQMAAELLDGSGDGVWLVELAPLADEDAVAPAIAETLHVAVQSDRPVLESVVDALLPQHILIVLDNCEHLIGACAKIVDALVRRCPQVHVVATSREPLGITGEAVYRVPSLSLPAPEDTGVSQCDAVALFLERAADQGARFAMDDDSLAPVVSVCRRLDGMPLAIELAAARLRSLSLADLSDRLHQRFRLLTGGSRSALPRQQTLRATVDWSYSLLNGAEQAVLRRLAVFVEGFDLRAAEAVTSLSDIEFYDITDLVSSLVDKSLVVAEPFGDGLRYRLLETIRQFGAERLVDAGEEEASAVATAHRDYFLALAEEAAPLTIGAHQKVWFERLRAESANLQRAFDYAVGTPGDTALVLRFARALRHFWWLHERGTEDLIGPLIRVLERPEAEADPALLVDALVTVALCQRSYNNAVAKGSASRAIDIARQIDNPSHLVDALWIGCAVSCFGGALEEGRQLGAEAVERARKLGGNFQLACALGMYLLSIQLSSALADEGYEELMAEAIDRSRQAGSLFLTQILMNNAASATLRAGDVALARTQLEEAERIRADIGVGIRSVDVNLAWVLRLEGELEGAALRLHSVLRAARRGGDRLGIAYAILGFGCLCGDRGDWTAAAQLHGAAMALFEAVGELCQEPESTYRLQSARAGIEHIGEAEWQRLFRQGRVLEYDQVLDLTRAL
ncbi:MAG TPA: adenylate/guanylate cyclase domain-containing protein [Acidimicrobiales bacterium]|nr:adenylate/guanylate cyclase domain-containing protein [Acidimicrobiales bacterium]